jgi:aminoglycoside phosphotransferase (APT) family kinase protein
MEYWGGEVPITPLLPHSMTPLPFPLAARVLAAHGLGPLRELRPVGGGWINRVYLLNGGYALRLRPAEKSGGAFLTEQALFARLRARLPVPELIAVDTSRSVVDADYMLARLLPGESLTRAWLRAAPIEQERLMAAFAGLLRQLHEERFPACGGFEAGELQPCHSWQSYFAARFERRLGVLRQYPNADRDLLAAIERCWRRYASNLAADDPRLVHRDLHFGNVLVDAGRISGVLDFEAAVAAPIDYELDQISRFLRYPQLFVEPELERSCTRERFAAALPLLRRHYPELFAAPRLPERLTLYSLEFDLAALRDCYAGRWVPEALAHVLQRIGNALSGRV